MNPFENFSFTIGLSEETEEIQKLGEEFDKIEAELIPLYEQLHTLRDGRDLTFLQIQCGNNVLPYEFVDESVIVYDYSCDDTSSETSNVVSTGEHHLEFTFGSDTAVAHNDANGPTLKINKITMGQPIETFEYTITGGAIPSP